MYVRNTFRISVGHTISKEEFNYSPEKHEAIFNVKNQL